MTPGSAARSGGAEQTRNRARSASGRIPNPGDRPSEPVGVGASGAHCVVLLPAVPVRHSGVACGRCRWPSDSGRWSRVRRGEVCRARSWRGWSAGCWPTGGSGWVSRTRSRAQPWRHSGKHPEAGPLLAQLETWLHRPGPPAPVDVAALACPVPELAARRCRPRGGPAVNLKDIPLLWPSFAHAWVLYGLVLPALFLAWVWGNRWVLPGRRVVLPLDRARGRGGWWWWTLLGIAESIPPLLLAVTIVHSGRSAPQRRRRSRSDR